MRFFVGILALLSALLVSAAPPSETDINVCGLYASVQSLSGLISLSSRSYIAPALSFSLQSLTELDASANPITSNGHAIKNIAQTQFVPTKPALSSYGGVRAYTFQYVASGLLNGNVSVSATAVVFVEAGTVNSMSVQPGYFKVNFDINSWPFCGAQGVQCAAGQVGTFLQLDFLVTATRAPAAINDTSYNFLIDGSTIEFAQTVTVDGSVQSLNNPPVLRPAGDSGIISLQLPKFRSSLSYDPKIVVPDLPIYFSFWFRATIWAAVSVVVIAVPLLWAWPKPEAVVTTTRQTTVLLMYFVASGCFGVAASLAQGVYVDPESPSGSSNASIGVLAAAIVCFVLLTPIKHYRWCDSSSVTVFRLITAVSIVGSVILLSLLSMNAAIADVAGWIIISGVMHWLDRKAEAGPEYVSMPDSSNESRLPATLSSYSSS